MGREIRMVPLGWEHPRWTKENARSERRIGEFIPLYDEDFKTAADEWLIQCDLWRCGVHKDCAEQKATHPYYWQWNGGPPDPESYRQQAWTEAEATHVQMYETVSEGTPVSPVFATRQELAEYLIANGDFWDQRRTRDGRQARAGWDRVSAEAFANAGWAPSAMASQATGLVEPRDAAMWTSKEKRQ